MRCPRCHGETGHAAIRCADCGAPLALPVEAPARPLDRPLDLDRRGRGDAPAAPAAQRPPLTPASADDLAAAASVELLAMPPPGTALVMRRGGSGRRVVAWLVDGVPFGLGGLALVAWLGADDLALVLELLAVVGLASFAYQTLAHALAGATLGKRLVGLRVVGPDGRRPGPGRSALRAAVAVAGLAALGVGPLLALFTLSGRALHDLVAGTTVVDSP
jgi:uncharacterized RDD family membrane protein YckC